LRTDPEAAVTAVDGNDAHAISRAANDYMASEAKAGRTVFIDQAVMHVTAKLGGAC